MNALVKLGLSPVDAQASPARANSIINALIEQLPAPGAAFGGEERAAWLHMMETAFTLVYGAATVAAAARPATIVASAPRAAAAPARRAIPARRPAKKAGVSSKAKPKAKLNTEPKMSGQHIDLQGYARNEDGSRILPGDVIDVLSDLRGEHGDLSAIIWSDDTRGIPRGMQIEVSGAGAPRS